MPARGRELEVDFSDEESVKAAMAVALEVGTEDLEIEEDKGLTSFREGTVYLVTMGREEYQVVEDSDTAEKLAIAVVTQDLESEPEIFNQDFIQQHIDKDKLRRELQSDVESMAYEDLSEEAKRRPLQFMEEHDIEIPSPTKKQLKEYAETMSDEDRPAKDILAELEDMSAEDQWAEIGEEPEVKDSDIEKLAEGIAEERLEDPVAYLEEIYGDEAAKKAIDIAGIDVAAAAEEAVSTDGVEHFLARYDGYMHDGPGGIVYWRSN